MRYVLYTVLAIGFCWGLFYNDDNLLLATYKIGFVVAMWGYAFLTIVDITYGWMNKNSPLLTKFYIGLKTDLLVTVASGITLMLIFYFDQPDYSFSNIDIAGMGIPFMLYGLFACYGIGKAKIAGKFFSKTFSLTLFTILCIVYISIIWLLIKVSSNAYLPGYSMWLQISVVCGAFFTFIESKRILFFLEAQRAEASPILRNFFSKLPQSTGFYESTAKNLDKWNEQISKLKREQRKRSGRHQKRSKRRMG